MDEAGREAMVRALRQMERRAAMLKRIRNRLL